MARRGLLAERTLVATVMSNLGLRIAMAENDITVMQTRVGDRYVLEAMNEGGYSLGGEQSGHLVIAEHATTGDGILTGIQILGEMAATGKSLHELASVMTVYPQVMINVRGVDRDRVGDDAELNAAVARAEAELGDTGRILMRASGTEPMIRVMVEAADQATAERHAEELAALVTERLAI